MTRRARLLRILGCCALALLCGVLHSPAQVPPVQAGKPPTVGMPGRLEEVVLPGPELEVLARDAKDPLVLRITRVSPHGSEFRYDFEYAALEPGQYDLRSALRHKDGTPVVTEAGAPGALPPIPIEVVSLLEPGVVKPHAPPPAKLPRFGGYQTLMISAGILWLLVLGLVLFGWRKRHREHVAAQWKPRSLAERLRPLVENAVSGKLSREERAQLELGLVAYWRRKLALEHEAPARTMVLLREHAEAGPLLKNLEAWLHMPAAPESVDVKALLAPYRDLPEDAIPELRSAAAAGSPQR